jgi:hypothetical protein
MADWTAQGREPKAIGSTLDRSRLASPWRGRSPAGWQFRQRGCVSTLPSSVNIAADRAAVSPIDEKLSTLASGSDGLSEAA